MRRNVNDQKQFILDYINEHGCTDVCDAEFHSQFWVKFGGLRTVNNRGALPVHKAMRLLASMAKKGELHREIHGGERLPGMPKWFYSYSIE